MTKDRSDPCGAGRVNDESNAVVPGFTVYRDELEVLAHRYLDQLWQWRSWWEWSQQVGGSEVRQELFACRRFETIAEIVTNEEFEVKVKAKIERYTRELRELEALVPCDYCGTKHADDDVCHKRTPPCPDCGVIHKRPYMACPPPSDED